MELSVDIGAVTRETSTVWDGVSFSDNVVIGVTVVTLIDFSICVVKMVVVIVIVVLLAVVVVVVVVVVITSDIFEKNVVIMANIVVGIVV